MELFFIQLDEGKSKLTMPKGIRTHYNYADEACIIASNIVHRFDGWTKPIVIYVKSAKTGEVYATYENIMR